jgi:hypothetical protein
MVFPHPPHPLKICGFEKLARFFRILAKLVEFTLKKQIIIIIIIIIWV